MNINWKITGGKTLSQDSFELSTKIKEIIMFSIFFSSYNKMLIFMKFMVRRTSEAKVARNNP